MTTTMSRRTLFKASSAAAVAVALGGAFALPQVLVGPLGSVDAS